MEDDFLEQTRDRDIDLVVVTDAEAILGIGDQGVGICTAKAVIIYTSIGGIDPSKILSVTPDVGTDNESLSNDELYLGWQHKRVRVKNTTISIDKFMQLVRKHYPTNLVHFEDFGVANAHRLFIRYSPLDGEYVYDPKGETK
ncbi:putative malic enzyme [Lyophyllum shimeji]|uniref:Malic enzyme n=1 Tax=Lyophyllum shimeji TaxID=47721 RepID=A0A9P3UHZ2_LYOSH|nr:putative malic enzyme [Lyophyllum shimeji]